MRIMKQFLILLACLGILQTSFAQDEELLAPEKAFSLQARVENNAVIAEYTIAPGYYMYREAFRFDLETDGVTFGEASVPDGMIKHDDFFGDVEIYRDSVAIKLPVLAEGASTPAQIKIKTTGQGCADMGVCYPPLYQTLSMNMPSSASVSPQPYEFKPVKVAAAETVDNSVAELQNLFAQATENPAADNANDGSSSPLDQLQALGADIGLDDEEEIPDPDKAFQLGAVIDKNNIIQAEIQIYSHTYLYKNKMKFKMLDGEGHTIGAISLPKGDEKNDEFFGLMEVYHDYFKVSVPVISDPNASAQYVISMGYQGCVEDKICYPPITKYLKVDLASKTLDILDDKPALSSKAQATAPPSQGMTLTSTTSKKINDTSAPPAIINEQDKLLQELQSSGVWYGLLLSLGFGILVAFTACMYPLIPILSSLIMGQGEKITAFKAFNLSLAYTQGIAITFGILGAIFALLGKGLGIQGYLQTPWVLIPSALLFIGLALSMFGFYQIQMPSFLQSRLNEMSNNQQGGSFIGVALMGMFSALIVGPCGGPILIAVLGFASQSGNAFLGFFTLWLFGTGMGLPLLAMGSGGGSLLPKAGTWMDTVKATGGIIMIALAISFLERLSPTYIPISMIMLMWGSFLIIVSIYMGATKQLSDSASGWHKLWKGLGVVILIYGALFIIGVAVGNKDTLQPLKGLNNFQSSAAEKHLSFKRIKTIEDLELEVLNAKKQNKPVLLDFYADWCVYCKTMEKEIFPNPTVKDALKDFVLLQADITRQDEADTSLMNHLDLTAPPAIYFWNSNGEELRQYRIIGNVTAEQLANRANLLNP